MNIERNITTMDKILLKKLFDIENQITFLVYRLFYYLTKSDKYSFNE